MSFTHIKVAYLWLFCLLPLAVWAAKDNLGDIIPLKTGTGSVTAILKLPLSAKPKGAFLLLSDSGGQTNPIRLMEALRIELTQHTWATLSIALSDIGPLLGTGDAEKKKKQQEIQTRLESGLAYLNTRQISPIVILAYGASAPVTLEWLAAQQQPACAALVLLGAHPLLDKKAPPAYANIQIPVLDIIAADDYDIVTQAADVRTMHFKATGKQNYQTYLINGANHDDGAMYGLIAHKIRGWLKKHKVMEASTFS